MSSFKILFHLCVAITVFFGKVINPFYELFRLINLFINPSELFSEIVNLWIQKGAENKVLDKS